MVLTNILVIAANTTTNGHAKVKAKDNVIMFIAMQTPGPHPIFGQVSTDKTRRPGSPGNLWDGG